jgi:polyribonucleotide nucleotidyltransferase
MSKKFTLKQLGLTAEIGKVARQADGSVWLQHGDNIVLATAVATKDEKDFIGFFPLTVEYREKTSAAGRIPGGYIKREGRLSDKEVLSSRLIDRPIRPLFPKYYFNEVQLISSVYSYDGKFPSDILALIASSLALTISDIPFLGPIGGVKLSRINGSWKCNVSREEAETSDVELIIAGTKDGICMVEGNGDDLSEKDLIEALFHAHDEIKSQIIWQEDIAKELGLKKAETPGIDYWNEWEEKVRSHFKQESCEALFVSSKSERKEILKNLQQDTLHFFENEIDSGVISKSQVMYLFDTLLKEYLPNIVAKKNKRIDGRGFDTVRSIEASVSLLPSVHGSAVFRRGETQALASLTLGTAQDAQRVEGLEGESARTFMLHYNFPPFSTGEVKPIRGVGRREIGHGYLAERSFSYVLPSQEEFPYTIRSLVDVLESNGSSSMATVCATTLALMDAGVPIKGMISGIAMGLMKSSDGDVRILTDILGTEDAFGLMDFKVTGTEKGIMAVQMDIKAKAGLTKELLKDALEQARVARLHILDEMKKVLSSPRKELSSLAPRVSSFRIDTEKIGAGIGPSGKTIKEIIAETGTQIDISDDGMVRIYSPEGESARKAEAWIKTLVGEIEVGTTFEGKVRRVAEFGIFVELVPGKDGLIHISTIAREKQKTLPKNYKIGDLLKVKVIAVEAETGRIRLIAPELK